MSERHSGAAEENEKRRLPFTVDVAECAVPDVPAFASITDSLVMMGVHP